MEFTKNQIVTLEITDISHEGEGVGKVEGFTFFVKDTIPGDRVTAKVMKTKKTYGYARLEEIVEPSQDRVEPICPQYKACGGCQLQTMRYDRQLAFKQDKVYNNLLRIGCVPAELLSDTMEPVVGMEEPLRYRNKAQYPVGRNKEGEIITGFYAGRTHSIIANTECYLGVKDNKQILEQILAYMKKEQIAPYCEEDGSGLVRHILIRTGFTSKQIMVCLIVNMTKEAWEKKGKTRLHIDALIEALKDIPGMSSISIDFNTRRDNVIMGDQVVTVWGSPVIADTLHTRNVAADFEKTGEELQFHISPLSFYQVNPIQTEKLYSIALDYAGLTGKETVWDLYCGIGTISLFLSQRAGKVYGVEVIPQAIEDAKANAKRNGITNAEFFVGKAEEVLPAFYEKLSKAEKTKDAVQTSEVFDTGMLHPDVIVVDPPRKGCDTACLDTMLKMQPKKIVYVSCDSATLARDVKYLREQGYELEKWRAVDQFAMTVHVETVVLLSKGEVDSKKVRVEFSLEDMDMSDFQDSATYTQIKDYVLEHSGLKVSNLYISQIKRKCGIEVGKNYNLPKSEDSRQPQCPPEKEKAIREAFEYFGLI